MIRFGRLPDDFLMEDVEEVLLHHHGGGDGCPPDPSAGEMRMMKLMLEHGVVWHTSCRNKINQQKVDRATPKRNEPGECSPPKKRRTEKENTNEKVCFICDLKCTRKQNVRRVQNMELDSKVRKAAELSDHHLLGKLLHHYLVAMNARYHTKCIAKLLRRANQASSLQKENEPQSMYVNPPTKDLQETLHHIATQSETRDRIPMSEVTKFVNEKLQGQSSDASNMHSTRLRQDIMSAAPELTCEENGGRWDFVFNGKVQPLSKASEILRTDMLRTTQTFTGSFSENAEENSVPDALVKFIVMLIDGTT
jgi:hypothetical protein